MGLLSLADIACRWVVRLVTGPRPPQSLAPELLARMTESADAFDFDAFRAASADLVEDSVRMAHEVALTTADRRGRRHWRRMGSGELADALYAMVEPSLGGATAEAKGMFREACRRYSERMIG